jgi:hypothetical protein
MDEDVSNLRAMTILAKLIHNGKLAGGIKLTQYNLKNADEHIFIETTDALSEYQFRLAQTVAEHWVVEEIGDYGKLVDITLLWAAPPYRGTSLMKDSLNHLLNQYCSKRAVTITIPFPLQHEGQNGKLPNLSADSKRLQKYYIDTYDMRLTTKNAEDYNQMLYHTIHLNLTI